MSFYIQTKNKKTAQKILDEIIRKHSSEISDYDLYNDEIGYSENAHIKIEMRNVGYKGGSLEVTIPSSVAAYMGIKRGDTIGIVTDEKLHKVYLIKPIYITSTDGRKFRLSTF